MFKPERRVAERDCWCRACSAKLIKKETEGVFWHSTANRGMNIILCLSCARGVGDLASEQASDEVATLVVDCYIDDDGSLAFEFEHCGKSLTLFFTGKRVNYWVYYAGEDNRSSGRFTGTVIPDYLASCFTPDQMGMAQETLDSITLDYSQLFESLARQAGKGFHQPKD